MEDELKIQLIKDEYLHLHNVIETFDGKAITIKAWSVSFGMAAVTGAFASHSPIVFLIASLSTILFWLIEGYWKTFQYTYYDRIEIIEKYFKDSSQNIIPFQIGSSWYINWKTGGRKRLTSIMFWPHVALPHLIVFILGILLYILEIFEMIKF